MKLKGNTLVYLTETHIITDNQFFLKVTMSASLKTGTNKLNRFICPAGIIFFFIIFSCPKPT
jgi:hypothetical protein